MRDAGIENERLKIGDENCIGQKRVLQTPETVFITIRAQRRPGNPKNNFNPNSHRNLLCTAVQVPKDYATATGRAGPTI